MRNECGARRIIAGDQHKFSHGELPPTSLGDRESADSGSVGSELEGRAGKRAKRTRVLEEGEEAIELRFGRGVAEGFGYSESAQIGRIGNWLCGVHLTTLSLSLHSALIKRTWPFARGIP